MWLASFRIDLSYDEPGQYSMNGLNSVPSPVDEAIKVPMLADALRVVGKENHLKMGKRRAKAKKTKPRGAVAGVGAVVDEAEAAEDKEAEEDEETGDEAREEEAGGLSAEEEAVSQDGRLDHPEATVRTANEADAEAGAGRSGVHRTGFHAVSADPAEQGDLELLTRLTALFERHTPASVRREESDPKKYATPPEGLQVPGPRWKGAAAFGSFLQSAGLLVRATPGGPTRGALGRPDVDLIFLSICGRGGSMGVLDFFEACVKVARRLWPERAESHPSELLQTLLDTYFVEDERPSDESTNGKPKPSRMQI